MQNGVVESLTLEPVPAKRRPILENLMQLYLHDFSEFAEVGSNYGEVGPDGRFAHEGLDGYWSEEGSIPFLFRSGGRLAGFALLNRWSALGTVFGFDNRT